MPDPVRSPKDVLAEGLRQNWDVKAEHENESVEDREWRLTCARDASESDADAALSALRSAGYRVVPEEPTEEMVERFLNVEYTGNTDRDWTVWEDERPLDDVRRLAREGFRAALAAWEEPRG